MTLHDLEAGVKGQIWHCRRLAEHDFQEVVFSFQTSRTNDKGDIRAFWYAPPFDIKDMIWQPFFLIQAIVTLRQVILAIYILYKSDTANCNFLNFRTYQWFSSN